MTGLSVKKTKKNCTFYHSLQKYTIHNIVYYVYNIWAYYTNIYEKYVIIFVNKILIFCIYKIEKKIYLSLKTIYLHVMYLKVLLNNLSCLHNHSTISGLIFFLWINAFCGYASKNEFVWNIF